MPASLITWPKKIGLFWKKGHFSAARFRLHALSLEKKNKKLDPIFLSVSQMSKDD